MATVLSKKFTNRASTEDILGAILMLANDKHGRVLLTEHVEWLEEKMGEISRLAGILVRRRRK